MVCGAVMPMLDAHTPGPASALHPLSTREFEHISRLAHQTFGLDLRAGKETLVSSRLARHMRNAGCSSFGEYYRHVVEDSTGEALIGLIDALATNHTSFFRETAHFDFLRGRILPQWRQRGTANIWSAACSTGEEPYSIGMCLLEEAAGGVALPAVGIRATDISTRALATAAQAIYTADRLQCLSPSRLRAFWLRGEGQSAGHYRVKKKLRNLVEFRRANLLDEPTEPGAFALIFCRNVMIYFDKPTQNRVVQRLVACLEPGGYLFTGHAESLTGVHHGLEYVQPAIYRKAGAPR